MQIRVKDTASFVQKARMKHGDYYDYTKSVYTKNQELIQITCPLHGDFWQVANYHTYGRGCKQCGISGYQNTKPGALYVCELKDDLHHCVKLGITNLSVPDRFQYKDRLKVVRAWEYRLPNGKAIEQLEQRLKDIHTDINLKEFFKLLYPHAPKGRGRWLHSGYTELYELELMERVLPKYNFREITHQFR